MSGLILYNDYIFQVLIIGTFMVASLFFSVYGMAVDTLFLCFCKYLPLISDMQFQII